jgi:hypothetical protein
MSDWPLPRGKAPPDDFSLSIRLFAASKTTFAFDDGIGLQMARVSLEKGGGITLHRFYVTDGITLYWVTA